MRWTPKRKAEIVVAINEGLITNAEANRYYGLSDEELAAWMRDYDAHGRAGLRVTKLQRYRHREQKKGRGSVNASAEATEKTEIVGATINLVEHNPLKRRKFRARAGHEKAPPERG